MMVILVKFQNASSLDDDLQGLELKDGVRAFLLVRTFEEHSLSIWVH